MNEYVWISALETSADLHGYKLIQCLKKLGCDKFVGIGGINMSSTGMEVIFNAEEFSVMGLFEVISHIPRVLSAYKEIKRVLSEYNIKKVIVIDAPDFHFKVAKMAHNMGIPVYYYISPQVWAWRQGRIKFLKKYITKVLCIFPFEKEFFKQRGLDVEYVGHPLMEYLDFKKLDDLEKDKNSIILLPGSRIKEVEMILPLMSQSCKLLRDNFDIHIKIVRAPNISNELIKRNWNVDLPYKIVDFKNRYVEMAKSTVGLVASGTASLECGLLKLPSVVVYKVSMPTYVLGRLFVKTNYISMTNIILNKKVFPELIQMDFTPDNVTNILITWFKNKKILEDIREELASLRKKFGNLKASEEAARIIMAGQ